MRKEDRKRWGISKRGTTGGLKTVFWSLMKQWTNGGDFMERFQKVKRVWEKAWKEQHEEWKELLKQSKMSPIKYYRLLSGMDQKNPYLHAIYKVIFNNKKTILFQGQYSTTSLASTEHFSNNYFEETEKERGASSLKGQCLLG